MCWSTIVVTKSQFRSVASRLTKPLATSWNKLKQNSKAATLIEYSILISLIAATVVAFMAPISIWVGVRWTSVAAALGISP